MYCYVCSKSVLLDRKRLDLDHYWFHNIITALVTLLHREFRLSFH